MFGWDFEVDAQPRFGNFTMFKICELWTVILRYELNPRIRCAFGNVYLEVLPSTMEEDAVSLLSALLTYQPSKRISARYRSESFKIRVAHLAQLVWLTHSVDITGMHCSTAFWPTPPSSHPPRVEVRKAFLAISRYLKRRSRPGWALSSNDLITV